MIGPIDGIGREAVQSSNIAAAGYDPATQTLAVEFKSGDVFHYAPVDADLALAFYAAESKGRFYSSSIRGKIHSRMMTGICPSCGARGVVGRTCDDEGCPDRGHAIVKEKPRLTKREDETQRQYIDGDFENEVDNYRAGR